MHADQFPNIPAEAEDEPRRLLSVKLAARVLGDITPREVYKRLADGDLESVKIGRRRMVTAASVDTYVRRLSEQAGAAA